MKSRPSYSLIQIGLNIRYLRQLPHNEPVSGILGSFETLERELNASELPVSLKALTATADFKKIRTELKTADPTSSVSKEHLDRINREMISLEKTLFSESHLKFIHVIPQRRYNGNYLLEDHAKLLSHGTLGKLSDIGQFDFAASCRCLCFGEATASAFHILRATEDTLKCVYFHYKKTNRLSKPMWGPMTTELRNKKGKKPDETILNALDLVRVSYRNPTQHPTAIYTIDSAQDLFGVCLDLLNKLAAQLPNR